MIDKPDTSAYLVALAAGALLWFGAAGFGLLPLGLVMFGVLAVPPGVAATLMARLRLRRSDSA